MAKAAEEPIAYDVFSSRVRRYRRSSVLRIAADIAAQRHRAEYLGSALEDVPGHVQEFALAGVARTAVMACNEFRRAELPAQVLAELCRDYINVADPDLGDDSSPDRLHRMLSRLAGEQFGFQYSPMENIGRALSLFIDHAGRSTALSPEEWTQALGVPLDQFMRIGFAIYVAVVQNRGAIGRSILRRSDIAPIFDPAGVDTAFDIIASFFTRTADEHACWARKQERPGYEKWSPSPFQSAPLVLLGDDLVAPAPRYIIDRISSSGLYFVGVDRWGERFTHALGPIFESYVGAQLRLLKFASVYPAVTFTSRQGEQETIDFFVVTQEAVILVEAKASRPVAKLRAGEPGAEDDVEAKIGDARDQILRTAQLLRDGRPETSHIPNDRPIVGLIITLEPFHLVETYLYGRIIGETAIPIGIASSHNLEGAVADLSDRPDVGMRLLRALGATDQKPPSLAAACESLPSPKRRNSILDDAWLRWVGPALERATFRLAAREQ